MAVNSPLSIVNTLVAILKPYVNCRVYNCCCGSGGMFVQSAKFIQAHSGNRGSVSIYGQEANPDTWKMAIMNLTIRSLDADLGSYHADTFTNDLHPTYDDFTNSDGIRFSLCRSRTGRSIIQAALPSHNC